MIEKITDDIKTAMKSKDKERLQALRYFKSMLLENKTSKSPRPEMDVLSAHIKKLRSSIELYPQGSQQIVDLETEIAVLCEYAPPALDSDQVKAIIESIISEKKKNGSDQIPFGAIMKELSPQIKGRFDGKEATTLVKSLLS